MKDICFDRKTKTKAKRKTIGSHLCWLEIWHSPDSCCEKWFPESYRANSSPEWNYVNNSPGQYGAICCEPPGFLPVSSRKKNKLQYFIFSKEISIYMFKICVDDIEEIIYLPPWSTVTPFCGPTTSPLRDHTWSSVSSYHGREACRIVGVCLYMEPSWCCSLTKESLKVFHQTINFFTNDSL